MRLELRTPCCDRIVRPLEPAKHYRPFVIRRVCRGCRTRYTVHVTQLQAALVFRLRWYVGEELQPRATHDLRWP